MSRTPMTSRRALRAAFIAVALLSAVAFAAANFVLVDVRLLTVGFTTRLAWAVLAPVAVAFGAGVLWARSHDGARSPRRSADRNAPSAPGEEAPR